LTAVVKGVAAACKESGCALIGGETAEMSGFFIRLVNMISLALLSVLSTKPKLSRAKK